MKVNFKWEVGDVIKMPLFVADELVETTILERKYLENKYGGEIWYETDLLTGGMEFTQEDIEQHN